jgi:hypothetical protein
MQTIIDKTDFDEVILTHEKVICFVHSPWSGNSVAGLQIFKEISIKNSTFTFIIINNESADGFIYEWLKEHGDKSDLISEQKKNWIHGNGEVFEIGKGNLVWFEQNIFGHSINKLKDN